MSSSSNIPPAFAANEDEVTPPVAARVLYPRLQWVKVLVAGLLFWVPKGK